MPVNQVLDFNVTQQAWEPRSHKDSAGNLLAFHAAVVRDGGSEPHALYQAESGGDIHLVGTGNDDDGTAIAWLIESKQYDMGGICRLQNLFLRLEPAVVDTVTVTVEVSGTEYGTVTRTYTRSLNTLELRIRLHREQLGRWVKVSLSGNMDNRPEIHDLSVEYVPFRQPRINS